MKLISDSREQAVLTFMPVRGVEYVTSALLSGDYTASFVIEGKDVESLTVIERKERGDLFTSYTSGYERERAKFIRAKEAGKKFVLAIEGTVSQVLEGHSYWKRGEEHRAKKDGMTMLRQLMSCCHKYGIITWFCASRYEMAVLVQEYFLAEERMLIKRAEEVRREKGTKVSERLTSSTDSRDGVMEHGTGV